ncbi:MAG: hypothetical protein H7281_11540 [Bacteriovorax sp.]|nr:hypothetical protein [Bacteriovorax sp.]
MEHLDTRFKKVQPAVIAVFKDHNELEKILDELKKKNFNNEKISILAAKRKDFGKLSVDKNILENVAMGTVIGFAEGGILCWLASLSLIAIPGAGTFIAAGPFISAIAGATLGANVGFITGALVGFGISEVEAKNIENFIKDKGVIVSVHVDNPREQLVAKQIFVTNGAVKVFNPIGKKSASAAKGKYFSHKLREV